MPTHGPDLTRFNLTQLRVLTGLAERTIRKRLGDLAPVARDGRTVWYPARSALERIFLGDSLNPQAERAKLDRTRRAEIEHRLARAEAEQQASIDRVVTRLASALRDRFLSLPGRLAPQLAADPTVHGCGQTLDTAIREILEAIAHHGAQLAAGSPEV